MAKVISFDNIDDMFATLRASRIGADLNRKAWQKELRHGDFVLRYNSSFHMFIWAELLDPVEGERACGADEDDVDYVQRLYASPEMEGFRAGRHFSVIVPDGELGDLHVSTVMCKISKEQFEAARAAGWPDKGPHVLTILRMAETVPPRSVIFPDYFNG